MTQQVEQAKKTLESVFIEVIDAIKSNTGPIAERLLSEYSLRNYLGGIFCFLTTGILSYFMTKIIKSAIKATNLKEHYDPTLEVIISGVMTFGIIATFVGGCTYTLDAVSPLYSLIKSLK